MAIRFTLHETPQPAGREGDELHHARALCHGTYKLDTICELIGERSSMSSADVKGVLDSLAWVMELALSSGYHIELEELGYFSPSLRTRQVPGRQAEVEVDGVNFRCSAKWREKLKKIRLEPVKKRNADAAERKQKLQDYLQRNGSISTRQYAGITGCSRYRAESDLKTYVGEGWLKRVGHRTKILYLPA